MPLLRYGPLLRIHRREITRSIGSPESERHIVELEEKEACRFLSNLLETPESLFQHLRTYASCPI